MWNWDHCIRQEGPQECILKQAQVIPITKITIHKTNQQKNNHYIRNDKHKAKANNFLTEYNYFQANKG